MRQPTIGESPELKAELDGMNATEDRLARVLKLVGQPGTCRGCGASILWVVTKANKRTPLDLDGESHFATCPKAADFRRGKDAGAALRSERS